MDIFNMFKKKTESPKVYEIPAISGGGDYPEPEEYNLTDNKIRNLYISNSWVRKYVNAIVRGCLKYKLQAVPVDGVSISTVQNQLDEVNALLTYANEAETFTDVREKYLRDLILYGNGAVELAPRNGRTVKFIYAAPGYLLRSNIDNFGNLKKSNAYCFQNPIKGKQDMDYIYSSDDIVHLKLDQLSDQHNGISPLNAAYRELLSDDKSAKEMQRGDFGVTPQVISVPGETKNYIDKLLGQIMQILTGRAGNKIVVASSKDIKSIKLTEKTFNEEFEFQKWLVQRHNIYGVPPFKLGFINEVGSASAREQRDEFLQLIETIVTYECEKLSMVMCNMKFKYDSIKIVSPALITRLDFEKARVLDKLVSEGIITPNEARSKYLGLPIVDDPKADKLRLPNTNP